MFDLAGWVNVFTYTQLSDWTSHIAHRTSPILAWRPILDPAPIDRYWMWFLPPLILVVAIVYRTIKADSLANVPRRAGYLAFQVAVFIVAAALSLWLMLLFV